MPARATFDTLRGGRNPGCRRREGYWHRAVSSVLDALDLLQERTDVVIGAARKQRPHAHRVYPEGRIRPGRPALGQASAQVFIDYDLEWAACLARFSLQPHCDVVVQCQRGPHASRCYPTSIMMSIQAVTIGRQEAVGLVSRV